LIVLFCVIAATIAVVVDVSFIFLSSLRSLPPPHRTGTGDSGFPAVATVLRGPSATFSPFYNATDHRGQVSGVENVSQITSVSLYLPPPPPRTTETLSYLFARFSL